MEMVLTQKTPRRSFSLTCLLGVSFLGVGILAGGTFAQTPSANPEPKAQPKEKSKAASKTEPAADAKAKLKPPLQTWPKPKNSSKTKARAARSQKSKSSFPKSLNRSKRSAKSSLGTDVNAKWACDQQSVTLDPIWRGNQRLTFAFDIRNEGTSALKIKARGG